MSTPVNLRRLSLMVMPSPLYECVSDLWVIPTLLLRLWLAIEEIIHHHDVMCPIIIRPRSSIAARDPHSGDARVAIDDAEEGNTSIAWRGRDKAAEEQPAVGAEALDFRAGLTVAVFVAGSASIRQVYVREDRAEAAGPSPVWCLRPDQARRTSSQ